MSRRRYIHTAPPIMNRIAIICARRHAADEVAVVLCAKELDYESLDSRQHAVKSEQPSLRVPVVAQSPENQEHDEAERDFVELRRMHRDQLAVGQLPPET